MFVLTFYYF